MKKLIVIFRFHGGLGDFVTLTSLIREINIKFPQKRIYLFSGNKEVFTNNPRIYKLFFIKTNFFKSILYRIFNILSILFPNTFYSYMYKKNIIYSSLEEEVKKGSRDTYQKILTKHWNLNLNYKNLKNEIYFSKEELEKYNIKYNFIFKKFALIHSEGKISYTPNKEIGYKNFQKIINSTSKKINWIQIGGKEDKKLLNLKIDLRAQTSMRELFYLISKSEFIVCQEGAYNHIANAFNTKAITIFTGFNPMSLCLYNSTIPIQNNKLPMCSPCMKTEKCQFEMKCINENMIKETINLINNKFL